MGLRGEYKGHRRDEAKQMVERIRGAKIPYVDLISLETRPPPVADESLGLEDIVEIARRVSEKRLEKVREGMPT